MATTVFPKPLNKTVTAQGATLQDVSDLASDIETTHELSNANNEMSLDLWLELFLRTMTAGTSRNVKIAVTSAFTNFVVGIYQGTVFKWSGSGYIILTTGEHTVTGYFNGANSSWSWHKIADNADIPGVVNNLTSDSTTDALSAAQGKALNNAIPSVVNNLTSDSTTDALSAAQGKALNSNISSLKNAKDLGQPASLSALQTLLATEAASMSTLEVKPIRVYMSPAYETFKQAIYIGYLYCNYNNGTRVDLTVTLMSGNGDAITVSRLNGIWSYNDLNANIALNTGASKWKDAPYGYTKPYKYEAVDTTEYDVPLAPVVVYVTKQNASRGVAICQAWNSDRIWINRLHDTWRGWQELATTTGSTDIINQLTPTNVTISTALKQEVGRLVFVYLYINTTSAITALSDIISGLPVPVSTHNYVCTFMAHSASSDTNTYRMCVMDGGKIRTLDAIPTGTVIRMSFQYFRRI